eukprot:COSAG01_NODE_521_length_15963_cov_76.378530_18_plen_99_part_00
MISPRTRDCSGGGNQEGVGTAGQVDPFSSVPFSAGARSCIGKRFTMLEAKVMLAMIVQRYEPHSPPSEVENLESITVRPKDGMPLSFRPRKNQHSESG